MFPAGVEFQPAVGEAPSAVAGPDTGVSAENAPESHSSKLRSIGSADIFKTVTCFTVLLPDHHFTG
ncbi:MAG: hypothetical protein H2076_10700 [Planctomycetes bacterium]|nr:hypothetical protein [Planctomycetota bacterium]